MGIEWDGDCGWIAGHGHECVLDGESEMWWCLTQVVRRSMRGEWIDENEIKCWFGCLDE